MEWTAVGDKEEMERLKQEKIDKENEILENNLKSKKWHRITIFTNKCTHSNYDKNIGFYLDTIKEIEGSCNVERVLLTLKPHHEQASDLFEKLSDRFEAKTNIKSHTLIVELYRERGVAQSLCAKLIDIEKSEVLSYDSSLYAQLCNLNNIFYRR